MGPGFRTRIAATTPVVAAGVARDAGLAGLHELACSGIGCGSAQRHMETVNKMGQRHFVGIAFRSYAGSRTALLSAARDLITASGVIAYATGGTDNEWYHDRERKHDFLASATLFKTDLPVEGILGMMAAVEERLGGAHEPAPLMKLDLLWVEGVELATAEVTLPSPMIFDKFWANSIFAEAAEGAMFAAQAAGREKASILRRVARAYKHYQDHIDSPDGYFFQSDLEGGSSLELERTPAGTVYDHGGIDEVDTLAAAGDLLLSAEQDVLRGRDPATPRDEDDEHASRRARAAVKKLPRDTVLPLKVAVAGRPRWMPRPRRGSTGSRDSWRPSTSWAGEPSISDGPMQISGAVLGHPAPKFSPYFQPGDTAVSSVRSADLPENRYAQEDCRDSRQVKLATSYYQRPLPAPR